MVHNPRTPKAQRVRDLRNRPPDLDRPPLESGGEDDDTQVAQAVLMAQAAPAAETPEPISPPVDDLGSYTKPKSPKALPWWLT